MRTQADMTVRVVAVSNLEAMCERISSTCHSFDVTKVSRSRVHVEYSNPDEFRECPFWDHSVPFVGNENPMTAVFPCYPNPFDAENPYVILDITRVINDTWHGEGWQAFQELIDCPQLYRSRPDANDWKTREEIEKSST